MDIVQIIITVGLVIAALLVLYAIIAAIFGYVAKRSFDKSVEEMDRRHDDFMRGHRL